MITYTFLALIIIYSLYCFYDRAAMSKYLFHPYSIRHNRQHYRFLTHAFIHGDYLHLFFNCLALYSFGLVLEQQFFSNPSIFDPRLGKLYYILLFTGGIYAASIAEYLRNKDNPDYTSLGASGAISSVLFCFIMISPLSKIYLLFIPLQGWIAGVLLLGISYYLIRKKRKGSYTDNVSHEAHFWGALYGVVFILVIKPSIAKHFFYQIAGIF